MNDRSMRACTEPKSKRGHVARLVTCHSPMLRDIPSKDKGPVAQGADNAIQRINRYPEDK